ncbi:MAG: hypothetical protein R3C15_05230 [Thermoleophilia bacterium]
MLFAALLVALVARPGSASAASDLTGTWACCGDGGAAAQVFEITGGGGVAKLPGGQVFATITASGGTPGGAVTIVTTYNDFAPGYVATFAGTLSDDGGTITGSWNSNRGQSGTFTATREIQALKVSGRVVQHVCTDRCRLVALAGVAIRATGGPGGPATATTGADGRYELRVRKGTWKIVPKLRSRKFDPASRTVEVKKDRPGVDFRTGCPPADESERRTSARTAAGTFTGKTVGVCPEQTFTLTLRGDGKVQLVSWSFAPVCTSSSGQVFTAKRVTLRGDEGDAARPSGQAGRFTIAFRAPFGQGHVGGRLFASGELALTDARFERAPDTQPPGATCPPVGFTGLLQLQGR